MFEGRERGRVSSIADGAGMYLAWMAVGSRCIYK